MPELNDKNEKDVCIKCNEIILEKNKLNNYPSTFSTYLCPQCGHENEWWILIGFDKDIKIESIVRALSFDAYLNGNEMIFDQIIQYIQEKYDRENFQDDSIQATLNNLYRDVLKKKQIEAIKKNGNIRYENRWNAAIDYFISDHFIKP